MVAWKRCLVLGLSPILLNCSVWLDVEEPQCTSDRKCVELYDRGYTCGSAGVCVAPREPDAGNSEVDLPDEWKCLAEAPSKFVLDPEREVTVRMDAVEFSSLRTPAELRAATCNPADITCESPVKADIAPATDGYFDFTVPHGWEGYLSFQAPNIVPSLVYNNRPWIDNATTSGPALATERTLEEIYKAGDRPGDPNTGLAILEVRDCGDGPGIGISFDEMEGEVPFYFSGALPTRDISATISSNVIAANRESRAAGGFSNIPPGIKTFTARVPGTDYKMEYTMIIRAGHISYVRLYPQWH